MSEDDDYDFGFSTVPVHNPHVETALNDKLEKVKKLIIPFLDNLMKDPEKDIHWPDRDKKLAAFKKKLLKIMGDDNEDAL